jgi:branched-subunit amino acid ABC-type transport system permease component
MSQVVLALGAGIVSASVIALGAVGFSMQFSISRIFNISYGAMMTISAYCAYYVDVDLHAHLWAGILAGGVAGCVLAVASERLLFAPFQRRRAGLFTLVMVALALDAFSQNAVIAVAGPGFYSLGIAPEKVYHLLGMDWTGLELAIIAIGVAAMLVIHLLLSRTRLGKAMRATAADPELAGASGINVRGTRTVAWAISGVLCGLGGVVLAMNTASFSFGTGDTFEFVIFAAAVVGGIGQPYGAMLGALIVGIATEEAAIVAPSLQYVVAFVLLVGILLVRPAGIIQLSGRQRRDAVAA